jgi:hypothetical protein
MDEWMCEWSTSRPCRFTPVERALCIHWIGRRVGPSAGLDEVGKNKFLTLPGLELQPVASSYGNLKMRISLLVFYRPQTGCICFQRKPIQLKIRMKLCR